MDSAIKMNTGIPFNASDILGKKFMFVSEDIIVASSKGTAMSATKAADGVWICTMGQAPAPVVVQTTPAPAPQLSIPIQSIQPVKLVVQPVEEKAKK